jgi:hypothetical protein
MGGRAVPVTTIESEAQAARPKAAMPLKARKQFAADLLVPMFLSLFSVLEQLQRAAVQGCLNRGNY